MVFFNSSEHRRATALLDARISETTAMLTDSSPSKADETTLKFLSRLVPVFLDKSGVAPLPKQAQKDDSLIPIAIAKPGQIVTLSDGYNRMNSMQVNMLARTSQGWNAHNDVVQTATTDLKNRPNKQFAVADKVAGFVLTQIAPTVVDSDRMGKSPVRTVRGRPFIGLVDAESTSNPVLTLHHEVIHSIQFHFDPVGSIDPTKTKKVQLGRELEAYVTTGMMARRLYRDSENPNYKGNRSLIDANWGITQVWAENVELKRSHETLWEPQGKVLKALEDAQLRLTL